MRRRRRRRRRRRHRRRRRRHHTGREQGDNVTTNHHRFWFWFQHQGRPTSTTCTVGTRVGATAGRGGRNLDDLRAERNEARDHQADPLHHPRVRVRQVALQRGVTTFRRSGRAAARRSAAPAHTPRALPGRDALRTLPRGEGGKDRDRRGARRPRRPRPVAPRGRPGCLRRVAVVNRGSVQ